MPQLLAFFYANKKKKIRKCLQFVSVIYFFAYDIFIFMNDYITGVTIVRIRLRSMCCSVRIKIC